jgi:uncharacterized repeat protein (TIGR03803 family)
MPRKTLSFTTCAITLAATLVLSLTTAHAADTDLVLYSFNGVRLSAPISPLIMDASGNLYGASDYETGGNTNGAIYRLSKGTSQQWTMTVLYEFTGAADGRNPEGPLILDAAGNLYGTTPYNGKSPHYCCGTVFELTPTASGPWKLTTLYSFKGEGDGDGEAPGSGLIFDAAGNLYGTTQNGGTSNLGAVFEVSKSGGGWTESILHSFQGGSDGEEPLSPLVLDKNGNLYGETATGGGQGTACSAIGCGTVFELTPNSGVWNEKVLYAFTGGTDGGYPNGPLVIDPSGNLYGAAGTGGDLSCFSTGCGVVFELSPGSEGQWTENALFAFGGADGITPLGPLILNRTGSLYGMTNGGGPTCNCGTIFELSPNSEGGWNENILYAFTGGRGGLYPQTGLVEDKTGSFYGATYEGGAYNTGTIFKIFP